MQNSEKIRLVILTNQPESSIIEFFGKKAKEKSIEVVAIDTLTARLEESNDDKIRIKDSKNTYVLDRNNDVILSRRGVLSSTYSKSILRQLEIYKFFCINTLDCMEICENKFLTSIKLENEGLPIPKTSLVMNESDLDKSLKQVGNKFPVVVKLLSGTQGIGVSIVDSYSSLKSVYQTIKKLDDSAEIILQEKIESDFDLRIHVLSSGNSISNSEVIAAMKRIKIKGDFRTNYSLGGSVKSYKVDDKISDIAKAAAISVGATWAGVDIIIDKNTKKPYILEVNSSPGVEGIEKVSKESPVEQFLDFILNKNNWDYESTQIGFREVVRIPKIGKMVAKFDTGNGSRSCSLHVDKWEVTGDKIKFEINGKKFTKKLHEWSRAEIGKDKIERPVFLMDIEFLGKIVKDVSVSPSDRTEKSTPLLVNRGLMKELGVIISPTRSFIVTNMEDYSPKKSKEDPYGGIDFE